MTPNDRPPKMLVNGAAKIMADELYVGIKGMAKLKGTYGHSFVTVPGFGYIDCEAIMETVLKTLAARGEITWRKRDE